MKGKGRCDVSKLVRVRQGEDDGCHQLVMEEFQKDMMERAGAAWPEEGMAEEKWTAVCTALREAAGSQLGRVKGHQPD